MRPYPQSLRDKAISDAKTIGTCKAAALNGISPQVIVRWCTQAGIRIFKPAQKIACGVCGKSFSVRPGNPHNRRFCSTACRSTTERVDVKCPTCGKITNYARSQVHKFCSHPCYAKSNINPNPAPKRRGANWKSARKACLQRSGGICCICKRPGNDVHHVIPFKYFGGDYIRANDQTNLETVCGPCHYEAERGLRFMYKVIAILERQTAERDHQNN